jgi:hypothetical protein
MRSISAAAPDSLPSGTANRKIGPIGSILRLDAGVTASAFVAASSAPLTTARPS